MPLETTVLFQVGKVGGKEAARRVLGIEDQLKSLHGKVDALRRGQLHSGMEWLVEAQHSPSREEADAKLEKASERFVDALGPLQGDHASSAIAAVYIAALAHYRARDDDARRWLRRAHDEAITAGTESAAKSARILRAPDVVAGEDSAGRLIGGAVILVIAAVVALTRGFDAGFAVGAGLLSIGFVAALIIEGTGEKAAEIYTRTQVEELEQLCELIESIGQSRAQLGEPASEIPQYTVSKSRRGVYLSPKSA
jgi:hypothetical protein